MEGGIALAGYEIQVVMYCVFQSLEIEDADAILKTDWNHVSTVILGTTCQQGYEVPFYTVSGRMVLIIALLVLMFLHSRWVCFIIILLKPLVNTHIFYYYSFSANIVGLIQSPSTRIRNLTDLLESRIKLAHDDTEYDRYYFAVGQLPKP